MHDDTVPDAVLPRKRRKGIYILPNLFTLAALFGGFYSIVMAMNGSKDTLERIDHRARLDKGRSPVIVRPAPVFLFSIVNR